MTMMRLSIHQTMGQIGVQTSPASQTFQTSPGELSIQQPAAQMSIESPPGQLNVDSSAAWDALGQGSNFDWKSRIYSQSKDLVLQAIARTASEGSRMADLLSPDNPFADIARERVFSGFPPIAYTTQAGYRNVSVRYEEQKPNINIKPQTPVISYKPSQLDSQYHPGSVDIYVRQKNNIDIRVSEYDLYS